MSSGIAEGHSLATAQGGRRVTTASMKAAGWAGDNSPMLSVTPAQPFALWHQPVASSLSPALLPSGVAAARHAKRSRLAGARTIPPAGRPAYRFGCQRCMPEGGHRPPRMTYRDAYAYQPLSLPSTISSVGYCGSTLNISPQNKKKRLQYNSGSRWRTGYHVRFLATAPPRDRAAPVGDSPIMQNTALMRWRANSVANHHYSNLAV